MIDEQQAPQDDVQVSETYRLVMGEKEDTYVYPLTTEVPNPFFIRFRHPRLREDEVTEAGGPGASYRQRGKDKVDGTVSLVGKRVAGFVAKCRVGIIDYCLPICRGGEDKDARFVRQGEDPGSNQYNLEVYTALTEFTAVPWQGGYFNLMEDIEAAADRNAGRTAPVVEDMTALGEGPSA
jgi:hypothetical protein